MFNTQINRMVMIGIMLILLSSFIGVLVFTFGYGKTMENDAVDEGYEIRDSMKSVYLKELESNPQELPIDSIARIIELDREDIRYVVRLFSDASYNKDNTDKTMQYQLVYCRALNDGLISIPEMSSDGVDNWHYNASKASSTEMNKYVNQSTKMDYSKFITWTEDKVNNLYKTIGNEPLEYLQRNSSYPSKRFLNDLTYADDYTKSEKSLIKGTDIYAQIYFVNPLRNGTTEVSAQKMIEHESINTIRNANTYADTYANKLSIYTKYNEAVGMYDIYLVYPSANTVVKF